MLSPLSPIRSAGGLWSGWLAALQQSPTISRHLKVLEREGVVVRTVEGRTHQLKLNVAPLDDAAEWFDRQRVVWTRMFDAVDELLNSRKEEQS